MMMMTSHNLPIPYYCTNLSSQLYECKSTAECGNIHCNDVTATHETTRRAVASAQHDGPSRWLVWYDDTVTGVSSCQTCQSIVVLSSQHWMWNIASLLHTHTHTQMDKQTYREMYTHTHTRTDSGMWERQLRIIMFAEW